MQDVKKGNATLVCLFLLLLVAGCGYLMVRGGALAAIDTSGVRAQATVIAAVPSTPTPEWLDDQVPAGLVIALVDRIIASNDRGADRLADVSIEALDSQREVAEAGLAAVTMQGLGPWCALGICALGVVVVLTIMRKGAGKQ